ncbi:MAG TPA: hypothetical protein VI854_08795, partial [Acidimicrobiia bacterium]|nr:hypothetical protein [Acidimicrobiia bacterium]
MSGADVIPAVVVPEPTPRRLRPAVTDVLARPAATFGVAGAAVAAVFAVSPLSGLLGWTLVTYGTFVALHAVDAYRRHGPVAAKDRVATVVVASCGLLTVVPLILIVAYVLSQGVRGLSGAFFT